MNIVFYLLLCAVQTYGGENGACPDRGRTQGNWYSDSFVGPCAVRFSVFVWEVVFLWSMTTVLDQTNGPL